MESGSGSPGPFSSLAPLDDLAGLTPLVLDKEPMGVGCLACGGRGCTLCTQLVLNQPHHIPDCMACNDQGCSLCRAIADPNPETPSPINQHLPECQACDDQGCSLCRADDGTVVECGRRPLPLIKEMQFKSIVSLRHDSREDDRPPRQARVCGFDRPFAPQQLLSWAAYSGSMISFPILLPLLRPEDRVVLGLAFFMVLVVVIVCCVQVCRVDPRAPVLEQTLNDAEFCKHCQKYREFDSHHCHTCHKCISHFDHHCDWFNTCIGAKNYGNYLVAIVAVLILLVMATSSSAVLLCFHFFEDDVRWRWRAAYGDFGDPLVALIAVLVINGPFCPAVLVLVQFHVMMVCKRMTTYEYLTNDRKGTYARRKEQEASLRASQKHGWPVRTVLLPAPGSPKIRLPRNDDSPPPL